MDDKKSVWVVFPAEGSGVTGVYSSFDKVREHFPEFTWKRDREDLFGWDYISTSPGTIYRAEAHKIDGLMVL